MLKIKKKDLEEIIQHARENIPNEVCGILVGKGNSIEKIYKMTNTSEDPLHCYFMDPQEQLKVFKEMRNEDQELLGIYHSHAYSPAYPSARDIELAFYPDSLYFILSLQDKDDPKIEAFKIVDGKIEKQDFQID